MVAADCEILAVVSLAILVLMLIEPYDRRKARRFALCKIRFRTLLILP